MKFLKNIFSGRSFKSFGYMFIGGSHAVWSKWDADRAIRNYKSNSWIYTAVNLRASAIASVPWLVEKKTAEGWEIDYNHPLNDLIRKPNPRMDRVTLFKMSMQHMDLTGNAYWLKVRRSENGPVIGLYPLLPQQVDVEIYMGVLKGYKVDNKPVKNEDIVHLMYTSPDSIYVGMSPLQAADRAAQIDNIAEDWQKKSFENRAVPDGVMTFEDIQTEAQFEQAKKQMKENYQGDDNARGPMVLGGKAKWTPLALTAAEMDFTNSRKYTRQQIFAVYGIPEPLANIFENGTYSNVKEAKKIFWEDTIVPILEEVESELNIQLAEEFGRDIRIRHDVSDVEAMQQSYAEKVNIGKVLWSMGLPFNTINTVLELGFEEIEGGDVGYLPGGLIPSDIDFDFGNMDNAEEKGLLAYGKTVQQ